MRRMTPVWHHFYSAPCCVGEKVGKKKCEGAADTFKRKVNAAGNVKVWQQLPCKGQGQI